jgi:hypothetical protein
LCLGAAIAAAFLSATTAGAGPVDLGFQRFGRSDLPAARAAMSGFLAGYTVRNRHLETFEGYKAWNGRSGATNPKNTGVGSFSAFGAAGSGRSVVGNGSRLQVRGDSSMKWGRYDTDEAALGGNWLDSNDNRGMKWKIDGVGKFNAVSFFVLDAADVGGKFSVKVGKTLHSDIAGGARLANGNIHFVSILLSEAVDRLTVRLMHDRTNDGFGVDGLSVARVAPVPLPPAAALMLPGILALVGLRRRTAAKS